jgi:hypothetical protein
MHLFGCAASFAGNDLPTISAFPPPQQGQWTAQGNTRKPTAVLNVTWHTNEIPRDMPSFVAATSAMAHESQLFSSVSTNRNLGWDYRLAIDMTNEGNILLATCLGTISGLTLTILPAYARDNYILTATVYDMKDVPIRKYQYKDHVSSWIQLFLLPVAPFTKGVDDEVRANMLKTLFTDIARDQVLRPVVQASAMPQGTNQPIPTGSPTQAPVSPWSAPAAPQAAPTAPGP